MPRTEGWAELLTTCNQRGFSDEEIGELVAISRCQIQAWRTGRYQPPEHHHARLATAIRSCLGQPMIVDLLGECRREGFTVREIAEHIGVSCPTVSLWSRGLMLPHRRRRRLVIEVCRRLLRVRDTYGKRIPYDRIE